MKPANTTGPDELYARWIAQYDAAEKGHAVAEAIARMPDRPLVSIVMTGNGSVIGSAAERSLTLASLHAQSYPHWEVLIPLGTQKPDPETAQVRTLAVTSFAAALRAARGEFLAFVEAGDLLSQHALAAMVVSAPQGSFLAYSDEDEIDETGKRRNPYFKGGWNPELFLGQDYACRLSMIRTRDASDKGRGVPARRAVFDLLLQIASTLPGAAIVHVPQVLYHRRSDARLSDIESELMRRSVEEHVQSLPRRASFPAPVVKSIAAGLQRVEWRLPAEPPRVSLIVPTRDRVELLRTCVDGLRFETDYPDLEILIVDNGSTEPETLAYLDGLASDRRVRVITSASPFNYSAINNLGVRHATGSLIGLINNDLKIPEPGWLREMASQALRPGVGAVGALLWYENGTVQHAGVKLGIGGIASHIFKRHHPDSTGYNGQLLLAQDMSAVTAACMLLPRAVWDKAGGLDENLTVAFNDIDLCLRIRAMGYRVLWTPHARLYHFESASRGPEDNPEKRARFNAEKARMRARWGTLLDNDPFFSPNLSLTSTDCLPAFPPRAGSPWHKQETGS